MEMILEELNITGEGNSLVVEEAVAKLRVAQLLPRMDNRVHGHFPPQVVRMPDG